MWIQSRGDRIYVGDIHESFHFLKYRKAEKQIYLFADCKSPRHLTSCTVLDYNTLAGADKFGNVFVVRLPAEISEEAENDTVYGEWMNSANHKLQDVVNFHLGDIVTSLQKVAFVSGDPGVLMYATISGALGAFLPFNTREDVDFFFNLELQMRQKHPSLTGRDHLAYRSYYFPIKDCIDGDLCEQYITLPVQIQTEIASELGCEPQDILGKIEEIRTRFI